MQIKTTVRYYFISSRVAILIKKLSVGEYVEKVNPHTLLVGM